MKLLKTGVTFLFLIGITFTGCAIKTCPTYSKIPHEIKLEKAKATPLENNKKV